MKTLLKIKRKNLYFLGCQFASFVSETTELISVKFGTFGSTLNVLGQIKFWLVSVQ
jgi:hypothetical protein